MQEKLTSTGQCLFCSKTFTKAELLIQKETGYLHYWNN